MADPKGFLIVPVGFNPDDDVRAFTVSADDYLKCVLAAGAAGGGMGEPKGKLATLVGYDPDGDLRALELDANDNLIISLLGGAAWDILRSDGTDAEWDTLADVLEAALMTGDGDLLIRAAGVVQRLAAGANDKILTMVAGVPGWADAPAGFEGGAKCRITKGSAQSFVDNAYDKVEYDTEVYDLDGEYDNAINYRFTAAETGYYMVRMSLMTGSVAWTTDDILLANLYKNGVSYTAFDINRPELAVTTYKYIQGTATVQLDATEYVEVWVKIRRGANTPIFDGASDHDYNWMEVNRIE